MVKQVTVIGSGGEISSAISSMAQELGRQIARRGAILVCGGKGGVMEAACRGAKEAGGLTVGILPGTAEEANRYVDVKIVTEMSDARNVINVKSGDVVVAVGGGAGTLSEIGLALKAGRRTIALKPSGGVAEKLAGEVIDGQKILSAESVDEAVTLIFAR